VFSNSQLLKDYERYHKAVVDRRPELKGQIKAIEQVLYDCTQTLLSTQTKLNKLPSTVAMQELDERIIRLTAKKEKVIKLLDSLQVYKVLKQKEKLLTEIQGNTHVLEMFQRNFKTLQNTTGRLVNLNDQHESIEFKRDMMSCIYIMTEDLWVKKARYQNINNLQIKTDRVESLYKEECKLLDIKYKLESVSALKDKQSAYVRILDSLGLFNNLKNSISTLKLLTAEGACPTCGSKLHTNGH